MKPRRILISQHSTITHYRLRFYQLLEERRPRTWEFAVVFDHGELQNPRLFLERFGANELTFPTEPVRTIGWPAKSPTLLFQTFFLRAFRYDAVITDNFVKHLTYAAMVVPQGFGTKRGIWGHTMDRLAVNPVGMKRITEAWKRWFVSRSDFFFAYTDGEAAMLEQRGYPMSQVAVLHNSVDTVAERALYESHRPNRENARAEMGLTGNKVILHVGRLVPGKRIGFLCDVFREIRKRDANFALVVVGGGSESHLVETLAAEFPDAVRWQGPLRSGPELARAYSVADLYYIPGPVGLAPQHAFCHSLPAAIHQMATHNPEIEYCTNANTTWISGTASAKETAIHIAEVWPEVTSDSRRDQVYPSVAHLSIEAMVENFIEGVNRMLGLPGDGFEPPARNAPN